jgi:hypothetical protein
MLSDLAESQAAVAKVSWLRLLPRNSWKVWGSRKEAQFAQPSRLESRSLFHWQLPAIACTGKAR